MADQHNTNIPAMGNEISSDVADIKENLEFHWDIFEQILLATSQTSAIGNLLRQQFQRSKFTYNGGSTAYTVKCEPAIYHCKDKYCYWDEELTTSAITAPSADTRYYLYLDYSAITSYTAITNTELIWSSTAPTWNDTYKQWMNSDDRCIFGVMTHPTGTSNIYEFFHDGGDLVIWADAKAGGQATITDFDYEGIAPSTTWDDVYLTMPAFASKGLVTFLFYMNNTAVATELNWRTNGQTGSTGHYVCSLISYDNSSNAYDYDVNTTDVLTDTSNIIEVKTSDASTHQVSVYCNGWYFPFGM